MCISTKNQGNVAIKDLPGVLPILFQFLCFPLLAQTETDLRVIEGNWKVDLSPADTSDSNFTGMVISRAGKKKIKGTFYQSSFQEPQILYARGAIYLASITREGSGNYHSSIKYSAGKMEGTTHSLGREFLRAWTATREKP